MKKLIVNVILLLCFVQLSMAQNVPNFFEYKPEYQRQGNMFAYQQSDQDGNDKSTQYYWFKSQTELTSKLWYPNGELWNSFDIVFDWNKMMILSFEQNQMAKGGKYGNNQVTKFTIQNDFNKKKSFLEYTFWTSDKGFQLKRQTIDYRQFPSFFGNLWGNEILFVGSYLKLPAGQKANYGVYSTGGYTEFETWQAGEEKIGGNWCTKYEFQPVGILGAIFGPKGRLWIDKATGIVWQYEFDMAMNQKKNYRATLLSVSKLTEQEWADFKPRNP